MKKNIFLIGEKYRTKTNFKSGTSSHIAGEVLVFDHGAYSPYDDCFIYEFHNLLGEQKAWILHVDSPDDAWEKYFEAI